MKKLKKEEKPQIKLDLKKVISGLPNKNVDELANIRENAFEYLSSRNETDKKNIEYILKEIDRILIKKYLGCRDSKGIFRWPTTQIYETKNLKLSPNGWVYDGVLSYFGYRVGRENGKTKEIRQITLSYVFKSIIPPIFESSYLSEWGEPESINRLKKIAETLASFARNAKRKEYSNMGSAISEWEEDLDFLYRKYYTTGLYKFSWPSVLEG